MKEKQLKWWLLSFFELGFVRVYSDIPVLIIILKMQFFYNCKALTGFIFL